MAAKILKWSALKWSAINYKMVSFLHIRVSKIFKFDQPKTQIWSARNSNLVSEKFKSISKNADFISTINKFYLHKD